MTPEQKERLEKIEARLVDVVLNDADPDNWTASNLKLNEMTGEERGDANWCRKTAVQSVALLIRVQQLMREQAPEERPGADEDDKIRAAEKEASKLLAKMGVRP
jgi:hypothetical protein